MFRKSLRKVRSQISTKRSRPRNFRPRFEKLEDRLALATAFGLSGTNLLSFDTASPTITQTIAITNVNAGETLVGIDFRPQNGNLYSMGVNVAGAGTLYNISTRTGFATTIGTAGGVTPTAPMPNPTLATSGFGFDFNPLVDRIRVVTSAGQSFAMDPNTGLVVANAPTLNGGTTTADGTDYTNNQPNATATTQYTIDSVSDTLYLQNPATSLTTAIGTGIGFDFTRSNGFDIPAGVISSAPSGTPVTTGSAFAILNVGGTTGLYSINLVTGAGTFVGNVGNGTTAVQGLAIQNDLGGFPALALDASGPNLVRFNTSTPGTTTTVAITGITAGETLVGIDFRPQTGQLFGLGINAAADNGTLYRIDPQTGAATAVGTPGQTAFVDAGANPIDLPDPATGGYGFDFNPTVDRIRVTTSTGLNFRLNPNNGAPVDGNLNLTPAPTGINPDGNINGLAAGSTGISGTAYTNSFGQSLTGGVTTQYTLDAASNGLFIQNPPNAGTQTAGAGLLTLGGAALDFTDVNGFDIPASVRVATSNTPATGFGLAALNVGGTTSIFQINLATGAATNLGSVATTLNGFTLGDRPFVAAATTTVLTSSANPSLVGDEVTFTAVVSAAAGTPTGTVTFRIDGGIVATVPLNAAGEASFSTTLDVGTFEITADFTSNISDTLNSSDSLIQSVVPPRPDPGTVVIAPDPFIPGNTALIVAGTTRSDTIIVKPVNGQARVILNGRTIGNFPLSDFDSIAVFADAGNDTVVIARSILQPTTIDGEDGNDTLIGGNGPDTLIGGAGRDTLVGLGGDDVLSGGDGNDVLDGGSGNDQLSGDAGNDTLVGGSGNDSLSGGDGNDKVFGGSGNDLAQGGLGNDKVFGEGGNDLILGEEGNDNLYGGAGRDILVGGVGADRLFGEAGDDILVGGATSADNDEATAADIFAAWTGPGSYIARMNAVLATGVTVDEDNAIDALFGQGNQDWFLIGLGDKVKDKAANEIVT